MVVSVGSEIMPEFTRELALANKLQASQMLFWEADYIEGAAKDLTQTMAARSR